MDESYVSSSLSSLGSITGGDGGGSLLREEESESESESDDAMMMSFEFFQISLFIFAPRYSLAMMIVSSRGAFTNVSLLSLFISLADDDDVVFIIIARKVREFVCILLQSVPNEVFALLGILLTNNGNFLFAWAALFQFKINCLNCKSSFHNNNNNNNNRKKKKKEERIIIERIVKVVSFIYTQNLRQQTTDAQIVHDL